ncbi:ArnT family glycosyltransferase [Cohaesibacter intestini]|uniref:ArnT family glycosyltransferase n=1 Tax=Cohaesibacter intestini TaxID=2211145 RepID=UPI000DEA2D16|nr:glycosyltransferase family 39 protein [Cohaesibacter intestini]
MSDTGLFPNDPSSPDNQPRWQSGPAQPQPEPDWITSLSDATENWLSALCSSRLKAFLALMLFALVCFMPGFNTIPPVDRDEARFAQASKQMMESGDYVDIRFQDGTRYKKPVGIYWLQVAGAKISGQGEDAGIWAYRLPSMAGALLSVGFTFLIGMRMASVRVGFLAGIAMSAAILLGVEARLAKADAMLLATILAVQWLLWELYENRAGLKRYQASILWVALSMGILIKGPIVLMVSGLTVLLLAAQERSFAWLKGTRWKLGIPLMLLITLPWFIAIGLHTDWAFYVDSVGKDMLAKVATGKESHGAPPGTYLAISNLTFWPVSIFLLLSLGWVWKQKKQHAVRFALSWILPTWVIFELVSTKLPHYVLPTFPALALLTALALENRATSWNKLWAKIIAGFVPLIAAILGIGAPIALFIIEGVINPAALGLGLVAVGLGLLSFSVLVRGRVMAAFLLAALVAPVLYLSIHGTIFPALNNVWLSNQMAASVNRNKPCESIELASVGYSEPSLVFLMGTDTQLIDPSQTKQAADFLIEAGCRMTIIEQSREPAFLEAIGNRADLIEAVDHVKGFKLNGGKWQSFALYRMKM